MQHKVLEDGGPALPSQALDEAALGLFPKGHGGTQRLAAPSGEFHDGRATALACRSLQEAGPLERLQVPSQAASVKIERARKLREADGSASMNRHQCYELCGSQTTGLEVFVEEPRHSATDLSEVRTSTDTQRFRTEACIDDGMFRSDVASIGSPSLSVKKCY